jgi:hypothetical protein
LRNCDDYDSRALRHRQLTGYPTLDRVTMIATEASGHGADEAAD